MAKANMCRAKVMADHGGVLLFKTILDATIDEAMKDYFWLHRKEEMGKFKLRWDKRRKKAEVAEMEDKRMMKGKNVTHPTKKGKLPSMLKRNLQVEVLALRKKNRLNHHRELYIRMRNLSNGFQKF